MSTEPDNLARLNANLAEYVAISKRTVEEAVSKQAAKLSFALSRRLQAEKPGKGAIRAERLAALSGGEGVHVRDSIRNRIKPRKRRARLNLQARRVRAELNLRERGRGFMAYAARLNTRPFATGAVKRLQHRSRYHQLLATAGLYFNPDSARIEFVYGAPNNEVGSLLGTKYQKHVNAALGEVADDMRVYLDRKLAEANQ